MKTFITLTIVCALATPWLGAQSCTNVNLASNGFSTTITCVPKPISFTADSGKWNVVAASSGAGHDYDLGVTGAATSSFGGIQCDYLIASGHAGSGLGATTGSVTRVSGTGTVDCDVQFVVATTMPALGTITVDWNQDRIVHLVEFEITSPAFYDLTVNGDADCDWRVYGPPANAGWQTRSDAVELVQEDVGENTVNSVALGIGWHCVVIARNGGPEQNAQTTIDTLAVTVCPAAAAVVLAEDVPIDLQPGCGEFAIAPVQDRYNVVALASSANWDLALGEGISDSTSSVCDFVIMREGATSPATTGVAFTSSQTLTRIEHDAGDTLVAGGGGATITGVLAGQEVVDVHELTINVIDDLHVGVFGGNGDSNFRWALFVDLPEDVWVRRAQALAANTVGGPPVLNIAVGSGTHDIAVVIFRNSGAPTTQTEYHVVVHDGFSDTLVVPSNGTAVANPSAPGGTVVPIVLQGPAAGRWNAVATQQPFAGTDTNIFIGAAAARTGGTSVEFALADGHQGGVSPVSGLAAPDIPNGTESINVKHLVATAIPPGGTGSVSFNTSGPQSQRPFFHLFELECGASGTGTLQVTTSSAQVQALFLPPAADSRWKPRLTAGSDVTTAQPLNQSFAVGPGFHGLAVWRDGLSTPFTTVTVTWTAPAPAPVLTSISPASRACGSGSFTLTATGSGFVPASEVQWNGGGLATTFVSPTQLTATVPAVFLAAPATAAIGVFTPAPGGGTSSTQVFTVAGGPPPVATVLLTPVVPSGFGGNVAIQGLGFTAGASVRLNGNLLAATFGPPPVQGAPATLVAAYQASHLPACGGSVPVTIVAPGSCGGESAPLTLIVNNPVPALGSVSPATAGSSSSPTGSFTLTATGSNFRSCSVVEWDGTALTTAFVSTTQLTAAVPNSLRLCAATASVRVNTPAGGHSAAATFTVTNPVPAIASLSPSSIPSTTGPASASLTVAGSNFRSCSVVRWSGTDLATTFVTSGSLTATVPAALLACGGTFPVLVFNPSPGGGVSAAATATVTNPVPALASVSPSSIPSTTGPASATITVAGSNFRSCSVAQWNGTNLVTTFVSATSLTADVPASLLACGAANTVRVRNPTPAGGTSSGLPVLVTNPAPVLGSIAPGAASAGGPSFTIAANGSEFRSCSVIRWNGVALATVTVSGVQIRATVPASLIAAPGTPQVTVFTPSPGGGPSASLPFTIQTPAITSISPASIPVLAAGGSATVLITGTGFAGASARVSANGILLVPGPASATILTVQIPASQVLQATRPGAIALTVQNAAPDAVSNTVALIVDGGTGGNNEGTVRRHPPAVAPGQPYAVLIEGGAPNAVFSLYVDAENPPPLAAWPDAAGNMVLSVGPLVSSGALFFPIVEGLGIFGPASGATLDPQGSFLLPGFVAPNPPFGIDLTVQGVYLDATAPLGFNLTWARWPDSL